jgi:hypothetical protein
MYFSISKKLDAMLNRQRDEPHLKVHGFTKQLLG